MHATSEINAPTTTARALRPGLRYVLWGLAALLGAALAWAGRFEMQPDGISYLDMADAYLAGNWSGAINGLWSPLYPLLLATGMAILKPRPPLEFPVVHLVNFVIYLGALVSFDFCLRQVAYYQRTHEADSSFEEHQSLPEWALFVVGYCAFLLSSLRLIWVTRVTPDMAVAAAVYLATGLLLKTELEPRDWRHFSALGLVLGLGYLAKAPMLPLAFIFLGLASASAFRNLSRSAAIRGTVAGLAALLLVVGLYVTAFHESHGRFSLGDSGRLNYAWNIDGLPLIHWQGGPPGYGKPVHPTRRLFRSPAAYEFSQPVAGTYPPWYDPAYWYEGLTPRFDARGHLTRFAQGLRNIYNTLFRLETPMAMGALALVIIGFRRGSIVRALLTYRDLLVPSLAAFGMFSIIRVEPRFTAPFVVLLWLAVFASVRLPGSHESPRTVQALVVAMILTLGLQSFDFATQESLRTVLRGRPPDVQLSVAQYLHSIGVREHDKVAVLGFSFGAYWARLAKVRIVAEIPSCRVDLEVCGTGNPPDGVFDFWAAENTVRQRALAALENTGAKIVVTNLDDLKPQGTGRRALIGPIPTREWRQIPATDYYVYVFPDALTSAR